MPTPAIRAKSPAELDETDGVHMIDERAVHAALLDHWQRLLARYGDFGLDRDAFVGLVTTTLRRRLERTDANEGMPILERLAVADLYLAQGCAARNPRAWRAFEHQYGSMLDRLALLFSTTTITADDARQELLGALFGGRSGKTSGFRTYRGISSLNGWLRVALRRIVIDLHRSRGWRPLPGSDSPQDLALVPDTSPTPEPHLVETRTARALVVLVAETITELPPEDRQTLLRYHRDGWRLEDLGRALGVHTATAQRRLERIRADVGRVVLRKARERLALLPEDVFAVRDLMADLFAFKDPTDTEPGT